MRVDASVVARVHNKERKRVSNALYTKEESIERRICRVQHVF